MSLDKPDQVGYSAERHDRPIGQANRPDALGEEMSNHASMLKHGDIWCAIDALARDNGLTASALARKAGLDPTTFNKSKRVTREGKPRWPSTESVAKILEATGASLTRFVHYIDGTPPSHATPTIPLIGLAEACEGEYFDGFGRPDRARWDEIPFPAIEDPHTYGLEITGDAMEPLLRDGDIIVVSPAANVRRGDRVVVKTTGGELLIRQLVRQTAKRAELVALNGQEPTSNIAAEDVAWMARILWISQ